MTKDMQREFANRDELIAYLSKEFPDAAAVDEHISKTFGVRKAAEKMLQKIAPASYAKSRNFLNGTVTKLSPYIRYSVLSLAEVRDPVLGKVKNLDDATKLINGGANFSSIFIGFNLNQARNAQGKFFVDPIKSRWFHSLASCARSGTKSEIFCPRRRFLEY